MNPHSSGEPPRFDQQQSLKENFKKFRNVVANNLSYIVRQQGDVSDEELNKARNEIDNAAENLHLTITNYFGDCDKRKLKLEAKIGTNLDVKDFYNIGEALKNC